MKILNIIQRYPPAVGGSERWCEDVSRYISKRGYFVKTLTTDVYNISEFYLRPKPEDIRCKLGRLELDGNITIRRYRIWRLGLFFHRFFKKAIFKNTPFDIFIHSPISLEMYLKMFREIKASDIVHLHTLPYFHNLVGFCMAKICGKKIVITPHFHTGHHLYENRMFYRLMSNCDAVLAVTEYEKSYLAKKGIEEDRIHTVGNCIYPELYHSPGDKSSGRSRLLQRYGLGSGTKIIIFIGARHEDKGWDTLISAVRQLIEEGEDLCLFLIGPGTELFDRYYSRLSESDKKRIIDLGCISHQEKVDLLHISDLLVLPSAFEAFGIVFMEAWICNKPVIGADRGAVPDLIRDAGLIFKYGDIDGLKKKIKTILHDESFARELAGRGRKKTLENYTWQKVGEKVFNAYNTANKKYRKRILIVSHLFPPYFSGGSELVAFEQARALREAGYEVKVFCGRIAPRSKRFALLNEKRIFEIARVNLDYEDFEHKKYANYDKEELQDNFKGILRRYAPDVVHFHNIYALSAKMVDVCANFNIPTVMTLHDYWGICVNNIMVNNEGIICARSGLRCIGCQHTIGFGNARHMPLPARNFLVNLSFNKVRRFISPSQYLAERFIASGFAREKFSVINNGVDIDRFCKPKRKKGSKIIFAYVGHFVQHKGIDRLIEAVSLLKSKDKMLLYLVGDGEKQLVNYYKFVIKQFSLDKVVKIIGKIDNRRMPDIYRHIDVLVLPALWPENSPVTIMEAMASKTPVLASDVGGIRELVEHGANGLLSGYDDPQGLSEKMEMIINNPGLIEKMGREGLERVKRYDLKNQVKMIEKEYLRAGNLADSTVNTIEFIMYQGKLNNPHTQRLFDCFKEREDSTGRPVNICLSDLLEDDVFAKAKALIVPHCEDGTEKEIKRAHQYKVPVFLNKNDEQLRRFSSGSDMVAYYDENGGYAQFCRESHLARYD